MRPNDDLIAATVLLARFSAGFTVLVDRHLGSDWAENAEILALVSLRHDEPPTTRQIAELSGLNRRAVSRLINRLQTDGLVDTEPSPTDHRAVIVRTTDLGRDRFTLLARDLDSFFDQSHTTATRICELLEASPQALPAMDALDVLQHLATVGADLARSMTAAAGPTGLPGRQRVALVQIASNDEVRPTDLGESLMVGRSAVAYVVDLLCAKGLVIRHRNALAGDHRAVILSATPAGHRVVDAVYRSIRDNTPQLGSVFTAIRSRAGATPAPLGSTPTSGGRSPV
jgi:DNA-binding MarR family transcriptional regulator